MLLLKFLMKDGTSPYQYYAWSLPTRNEDGTYTPGAWQPHVEDISMCRWGYHASTAMGVSNWSNDTCYVAEVRGQYIHSKGEHKVVAQSMRLLYPVETWRRPFNDQEYLASLLTIFRAIRPYLHYGGKVLNALISRLETDRKLFTSAECKAFKLQIWNDSIPYAYNRVLGWCFDRSEEHRTALQGGSLLSSFPISAITYDSRSKKLYQLPEVMVCAALGITDIPSMPDEIAPAA